MARPREIGNLFPKTRVRAQLDERERDTFVQEDLASGRPEKVPQVPRGFLQRMSRLSTEGTGLRTFQRPDWIARIAKAKRPHAEAVDTLIGRVANQPTEATLREAQVILNDIGQLPDSGKMLRSKIDQKLVDRVIGKGR
jgi:hypothetical protein